MTTTEELQLKIRDLEKKVAQLHSQIKKQRYGLNWLDVPEEFETDSENRIPILEEVPELAVKNEDEKPTHILIEGDNYHALTCLNYTHKGKVDVIYIDPPYNTGNDGFTYKDKRILAQYPDGTLVPTNHPLRHSYWLSFMSKRLELAKNLLSDRGVIFISIDDNEQANLKLLCDKVFGEGNCIANFTIASNSSKNNSNFVSVTHEYLLCYCNSVELLPIGWKVKKTNIKDFLSLISKLKKKGLKEKEISDELKALVKYPKYYEFDHYTYVDERGPFRASDLTAPGSVARFDIIHPVTKLPCKKGTRGWAFNEQGIKELIEKDYILFGEDEKVIPQLKNYLSANEDSLPKSILFFDSQTSTKWIKNQGFDFAFPKALDYIGYILSMYPVKNIFVLDFFAGSGTTLHAAMRLNDEDGGKRQCILVQQKESEANNICCDITRERNRRVMQGYVDNKGNEVKGLGNSLKYYRTSFVGKNRANEATDTDKVELSQKAGCLLALGENTLEETVKTSHYQIFTGERKLTAVYFTENGTLFEDFLNDIRRSDAESKAVYIFSWSNGEEFSAYFDGMRGVTLKSIPKPILDIYKTLNQ